MTADLISGMGLLAAFCTTISFLPQAIKTIRTRDTSGISLSMYFLFTAGTFFWLIYGIFTVNVPIIIANAVTLLFAGTILLYKFRNHLSSK
jgi:MtN3 and saliva related transmembrane protein